MNKACFFLLIFVLPFYCSAQQVPILKGQILSDSLNGSSINIVNLSRKIGTTNNSKGQFEIVAAKGDSLFFSSVQYEPLEIVVSEEVLEKAFLEVYLIERLNELEEVNLSNISLSGNLQQDIEQIQTTDQAAFGFKLPAQPRLSSVERKLKTASNVQKDSKRQSAGLVNVSLDGILNRLNGKIEMLEKASENEEQAQVVDRGIKAVPASYFIEDLKIPEEQIVNFVHFCAENPNFPKLLPPSKRFELMDYYRKKAADFIAERMPE